MTLKSFRKELRIHPYPVGEIGFGQWEQIFYPEFDGMRDKYVFIKIIGK